MEVVQLDKKNKDLFSGYGVSRIGGRAENQDTFGADETPLGFLFTVCDGMGGGPGGKTASTIAVREIITGIKEANKDEEVANIIIKAIRRANMAIIEYGNENPAYKGMGSTATVLLISETSAFIAHVGDSRVYQLRGKKKIFRTFDHSMVFEWVKEKRLTEEQARLSANSNIITRALGVQPDVEVDVTEVAYEKGDRFALCTDGIHGSMPEKELIQMLANKKTALSTVTDDIATYVDNIGRSSGGHHDNLTLVIIEMNKNSKLQTTMSTKIKYTLVCLATVCALSIICNIIQATSNDKKEVVTNTTFVKEKSQLEKQIKDLQDSISTLNQNISKKQQKIK